jgi:hypothetical protein
MTYCITCALGTGTLSHVNNDASLSELLKYSQNSPHVRNKVTVQTTGCKVNIQELSHRRCGSSFFSTFGPADIHLLSYHMGKNTRGFHFL